MRHLLWIAPLIIGILLMLSDKTELLFIAGVFTFLAGMNLGLMLDEKLGEHP